MLPWSPLQWAPPHPLQAPFAAYPPPLQHWFTPGASVPPAHYSPAGHHYPSFASSMHLQKIFLQVEFQLNEFVQLAPYWEPWLPGKFWQSQRIRWLQLKNLVQMAFS